MDNTELETNLNPESKKHIKLSNGLVASIVLVSLLIGSISGYVGGLVAFKYNARASQLVTATQQQTVALNEDSAIINVVHKASPAVVSIIISKNVNVADNSDPFSNPFFFDPFFNQQPAAPKNLTPNYQEVGAGSGFFISADGLILTNKHVVSDSQAKYSVVTNDGKKYPARVLSTDAINDLALVKIDISNAPTLALASSSNIQIGQTVIAIGNSLGQYSNTVTAGIISGIGRNITAGGEGTSEQLDNVIQTDAAINPGNSGGPLLNVSGDVVGVNTAIDQQGQLVGFAIPSNDAAKVVSSFQKFGKIVTPFLGIRYVLLNEDVQKQFNLPVSSGAWVSSAGNNDGTDVVIPGSAAEKAGIKEGDIITSVDNNAIDAQNTLAEIIANHNPGDTVVFEILRNGKNIKLNVVIGQK